MSEAIIRIPPRTQGARLESSGDLLIALDVSREETHEQAVELTRHPVEDGRVITDHAQPLPIRISIDGVISATPLGLDGDEPEADRHLDAYQELLRIARERQPVTLVTGLATYEDCVLVRVPIRRDSRTGLSIQGMLEFEQIRRVERAETEIPPEVIDPVVRSAASPESDRGRQSAPAATGAQARRSRSNLARLTGQGAVP